MLALSGANGSCGGGTPPAGWWPSNIGIPEAMELQLHNILVSPSLRLPVTWHNSATGYVVLGPVAPRSKVGHHPSDQWNRLGRWQFWKGHHSDNVLRKCRDGRLVLPPRPALGAPTRPPPPASIALLPPVPIVEIPPEQEALRPGFLAAIIMSTEPYLCHRQK